MKDAKGHGSNPHGAHAAGVDAVGARAPIQKGQFFTHDAGSGPITYRVDAVDDAGVHATSFSRPQGQGVLDHGQVNNLLASGALKILTKKSDIRKAADLAASYK
jgi:hypothetical protein